MPRCKAPEILRNEPYLDVRRNDEGLGKRSRWAFFSSLLVEFFDRSHEAPQDGQRQARNEKIQDQEIGVG